MKQTIDPGTSRPTVFFFDDITFSHTTDLAGNPVELQLSLLCQMDRPQLQRALGRRIPEEIPTDPGARQGLRPAIIWFNGNGWRGIDKNAQIGDLVFLAEHGYAVFCADFRNSAQAHFPAQIVDAKAAVRCVRANAGRYGIDPDRIGVMGRSAGGEIVSMLGLNDGKYISEEWKDYSSEVQLVWDMFGPADLKKSVGEDMEAYANGTADTSRWTCVEQTHAGAYLGGSGEELLRRAAEASPALHVHDGMPPFLIMHGDADPAVPCSQSEDFYEKILAAGPHNVADLYLLKGAGHGTPEFFAPMTQQIALDFLDKYLKG